MQFFDARATEKLAIQAYAMIEESNIYYYIYAVKSRATAKIEFPKPLAFSISTRFESPQMPAGIAGLPAALSAGILTNMVFPEVT